MGKNPQMVIIVVSPDGKQALCERVGDDGVIRRILLDTDEIQKVEDDVHIV